MRLPRLFLPLLLSLFCAAALRAQPFSTGLQFDDAQYRTIPQVADYNTSKADVLPGKVDMTPYCPTPGSQGNIGSCVGWASGYGAMTIQLAKKQGITDPAAINQMAMSALFVYNHIKLGGCADGANLPSAGGFLKDMGNVRSADFDQPATDCMKQPTPQMKARAARYRIKDYNALFGPDAPWKTKAFKVKQSLAADKPVVIGMMVTEGFMNLRSEMWDASVQPAKLGGHAMVVVGYDEKIQAFRIMNSWGKGWGKNGFAWVKYEDFGAYCLYGIQLVLPDAPPPVEPKNDDAPPPPAPVEPPAASLTGRFDFRIPKYIGDSIAYEPVPVERVGNLYEPVQKSWDIGQDYQLVASGMKKDRYVYVFSVDAANKGEVHFPESSVVITALGLDQRPLLGPKKSDVMPDDDIELIIPEPKMGDDGRFVQQAFYKSQPGPDHLCILYSDRRIEKADLEARIRRIVSDRTPDKPFMDKFQQAFADVLIPQNEVRFEPTAMRFKASSKKGYAVPLVLKMDDK